MSDFDQLASAGLAIVLSAVMLVTSLLFIETRSAKDFLNAAKMSGVVLAKSATGTGGSRLATADTSLLEKAGR